jgi:hypothetical protein
MQPPEARSNVRLASNVYPMERSVAEEPFRAQVRGREAIRALLKMQFGQAHDRELRHFGRGWLTRWQSAQMERDLRCIRCRRIPDGLDWEGNLAFRCADPRCGGPSGP